MSDNQYNEFAQCIMDAVSGKLSKETCQQVTNNLHLTSNSTGNTEQMKNLLEKLDFKKDTNNKYESVNNWAQRVKHNLHDNKLKNVLESTVETANKYSSKSNENVQLEGIKSQRKNLQSVVAHITSNIDGLNEYQKYMNGLLEKRAIDLGINVQSGGNLTYTDFEKEGTYNSYVDDEASTKGAQFYTASVLKGIANEIFDEYKERGIKFDGDVQDSITKALDSLEKKEKELKENAATLEKYLALRKYFPKNKNVPDSTDPAAKDMDEIKKLVEQNKNLLGKVVDKRQKMNNVLVALVGPPLYTGPL